jgi:hypothetical protein
LAVSVINGWSKLLTGRNTVKIDVLRFTASLRVNTVASSRNPKRSSRHTVRYGVDTSKMNANQGDSERAEPVTALPRTTRSLARLAKKYFRSDEPPF